MEELNSVDTEAIKIFMEGSTPEARRALGHLLRNALQPLLLLTGVTGRPLDRMVKEALKKTRDIVDRISK